MVANHFTVRWKQKKNTCHEEQTKPHLKSEKHQSQCNLLVNEEQFDKHPSVNWRRKGNKN